MEGGVEGGKRNGGREEKKSDVEEGEGRKSDSRKHRDKG